MTSSDHLSDRQFADYRMGGLAPEALLAIDGHLASCAQCRQRLFSSRAASSALPRLGSPHLDYDEVEAVAEDRLAGSQKQRIEGHISLCESCAAEVADLRHLRQQLDRTPEVNPQRRSSPWSDLLTWLTPRRMVLAGAFAAVVLVVGALRIGQRQLTLTAYNDGGDRILVDGRGNLREPRGLAPEYRAGIEQALRDGRVVVPQETLNSLRADRGQLRGHGMESRLAPIEPVGSIVPGQSPTLRWNTIPGASSYRASIYGQDSHPVARSPKLAAPEWTPDVALERGHRYQWEITAETPAGEVRSTGPGNPPAEFIVLDANQASELQLSERQYPNAHLLLGILYARAGMVERARQEFTEFAAANPQSTVARRLLESLPPAQNPLPDREKAAQ